jgi:hypothetical protein
LHTKDHSLAGQLSGSTFTSWRDLNQRNAKQYCRSTDRLPTVGQCIRGD